MSVCDLETNFFYACVCLSIFLFVRGNIANGLADFNVICFLICLNNLSQILQYMIVIVKGLT